MKNISEISEIAGEDIGLELREIESKEQLMDIKLKLEIALEYCNDEIEFRENHDKF